jgi:tripartite ATP-independent transporter DctM subunit
MDSPALVLALVFLTLLLAHAPVAVAMAIATLSAAWIALGSVDTATAVIAQRMATSTSSFSLLAIPFFVLSGLLMGQGGIARRLVHLAQTLVGRFPGGLALVNVLTCMLFGAISGSATAAVSSVGGFMIPQLEQKGYPRNFAVALNTTAATTGLLIPPSNIMIVFALASGGSVSIATLFLAGVGPGLTFGLLLMLVASLLSRHHHYGSTTYHASWQETLRAFQQSFLSLLLVGIVLGGILTGAFTATEAAAIAVAYAFLLSVCIYREVQISQLPQILLQTAITTSVIFLLIATSMAMSWIMALESIPQYVSQLFLSISSNPLLLLLLMNALLLAAGTFMDMTPAVLIFTPILSPVAQLCGMDPVHFGIMMIANLCIGLCTPPVGTCLFVGCSVGQTSITRITPALLPFFAALLIALLLITYVPAITLALPHALNLK